MALITPEGVLSYPKVFRSELPKDPQPGDKKAWSTTILFTREAVASEEFKALIAEAMRVLRDKFGPTVAAKIEWMTHGKDVGSSFVRVEGGTLRLPFRNDAKAKGYPEQYVMFLNPRKVDDPDRNVRAPEVIGRDGKPIVDSREIYPGVRARVSLGAFGYSNRGNKGVSFGLNNVQKLGDGPRIDNLKAAADEFGALPDEAPAGMPEAADLAAFVS